MYMKHRMRVYQGCYHMNPDYAYWYGWAMMTKDFSRSRNPRRFCGANPRQGIKKQMGYSKLDASLGKGETGAKSSSGLSATPWWKAI